MRCFKDLSKLPFITGNGDNQPIIGLDLVASPRAGYIFSKMVHGRHKNLENCLEVCVNYGRSIKMN